MKRKYVFLGMIICILSVIGSDIYAVKKGANEDQEEALKYLRLAASQGHKEAIELLKQMEQDREKKKKELDNWSAEYEIDNSTTIIRKATVITFKNQALYFNTKKCSFSKGTQFDNWIINDDVCLSLDLNKDQFLGEVSKLGNVTFQQ